MQESQSLIILLVIGFTLMLMVMGALFFALFITYNKKLKQRQNEAITNLLIGQQNERGRIARDLHDGIGAVLADIIYSVDDIADSEPQLKNEAAAKTKEKIKDAMRAIRKISHDLLPETLEKYDLAYSIQKLIDADRNQISIYFTNNLQGQIISKKLEFHLYNIILELYRNTLKYSGANEIHIDIFYHSTLHKLLFTYSDNGKGCDAAEIIDGIGLKNIKTRADLINGILTMNFEKGFYLNLEITM
jgi:two-component system NarL family sensor kinase